MTDRRPTGVGLIALLIAAVIPGEGRSDDPRPAPVFDCGTIALFHLLRWEGRPVALDRIARSLPPCPPEGYSMKQLRDVARSLGLRLDGVQLPGRAAAPAGPALAFLKDGDHGHYVAIRPVGHTGRLVQVADLDREPTVLEASALYGSPRWTGIALIRSGPGVGIRLLQALAFASSLIALAILIIHGRRVIQRGGSQG